MRAKMCFNHQKRETHHHVAVASMDLTCRRVSSPTSVHSINVLVGRGRKAQNKNKVQTLTNQHAERWHKTQVRYSICATPMEEGDANKGGTSESKNTKSLEQLEWAVTTMKLGGTQCKVRRCTHPIESVSGYHESNIDSEWLF